MRKSPRAQEKEQLEVPLRLGVQVVLDDHHAATPAGRSPGISEHGDEIVHQLRRSQTDFLRHPALIASCGTAEHSPKDSPGYLSGSVRRRLHQRGERRGAPL